MKVIFLSRAPSSDYKTSGLTTSSRFIADFLESKGVKTKLVQVIDSDFIDREVHSFQPTHVVIDALWVPPYKFRELFRIKAYRSIQWIVRIHSKIPFLANEGIALEWISKYIEFKDHYNNFQISGNSLNFVNSISGYSRYTPVFLPNMYTTDFRPHQSRRWIWNQHIDIGCFGAVRPFKNHLQQAMAAITFGEERAHKIRFHINTGQESEDGKEVLKNLRALFENEDHELVEHPWMEHSKFLDLIQTMDIGMQVSMSETYNIVAADFVNCAVPIAVSPEIEFLPGFRKVGPSDHLGMVAKLHEIWRWDSSYLRWLDRRYLESSNRYAQSRWLRYLGI